MKRLRKLLEILPFIVSIIRFNFHYLPWKQAIKLPIFLYHPHLHVLKGNLSIESERVTPGMIKLGASWTCQNQTKGFHWLNWGG